MPHDAPPQADLGSLYRDVARLAEDNRYAYSFVGDRFATLADFQTAGRQKVLELFGERMVARRFQAGIPASLYHKDIGIVLETARETGLDLPAASLVKRQLDDLVHHGMAAADLSSLLTRVEKGPPVV